MSFCKIHRGLSFISRLDPISFKICYRRWTQEEEEKLSEAYQHYGPAWSIVAQSLPNRSAKDCKKHWTERSINEECGLATTNGKPYSLDAFIRDKAGLYMHLSTAQQFEHSLRRNGFEKINGQWLRVPIEDPGLSPTQQLGQFYIDQKRQSGEIKGRRVWPAKEDAPWTEEEDMILREAYEEFGANWQKISWSMPTKRSPQACRYRLTVKFIRVSPIAHGVFGQ